MEQILLVPLLPVRKQQFNRYVCNNERCGNINIQDILENHVKNLIVSMVLISNSVALNDGLWYSSKEILYSVDDS